MMSCSSSSSNSFAFSKSSLAESLGRLVGEDSINKAFLFPIKELESFEIGLFEDKSGLQSAACWGILALKVATLFTDTNIDTPYHHFLIATAIGDFSDKNETKKIQDSIMKSLDQKADQYKKIEEDPNISFAKKQEARMKKSSLIFEGLFGAIFSQIKNYKVIYYLIEKGVDGKTVHPYRTKEEIFEKMRKDYHKKNEISSLGKYKVNKELTIENICEYISTLSNTYNLIDDNCQVFVRNILNHFDSYLSR